MLKFTKTYNPQLFITKTDHRQSMAGIRNDYSGLKQGRPSFVQNVLQVEQFHIHIKQMVARSYNVSVDEEESTLSY